jgi:cyanophycin synthetase
MTTTLHSSIELLQTALEKKGYIVSLLELNGETFVRFVAPNGRTWFTQGARIGYPFVPKAVAKISTEKNLAYKFCEAIGVRVPLTTELRNVPTDDELELLLQRKPLVVKPHNSSLSSGVTLNIQDAEQLRQAIHEALNVSATALVQEQVEGEEIRFTLVEGKVKAALLRQKPHLVGDSSSTLAQLLKRENEARAQLIMPYVQYPQLAPDLITQAGHRPEEVLDKGDVVQLGRGTMIRTGASIYNVLESIHPTYLGVVENLVQTLGARFVVVDMMLQDYTKPKTAANYAFIEFNTAPVLKLFYSCRDGKQYDVVAELAAMIDTSLTGENHENK